MEDILDQHLVEDANAKKARDYKKFKILLVLQLIGSAIGIILAWIEIASILGSGPILSVLGVMVFVFSRLVRNKSGMILGFVPLFASVLSFSIVMYFSLSPRDAEIPIASLLSFFFLLSIILGMFALGKGTK